MTALYIGGASQGKRQLAQRLHHVPDSAVWQGSDGIPPQQIQLLNGLHDLTRQMLAQGEEPLTLLPMLTDKITICDEIGCGIVPCDAADRVWREQTGRLCCALAAQADIVVRVYAGLPQVIKGMLPCG